MAECSSCGKQMVEGDRFCRGCGVTVAPAEPVASVAGPGAETPQTVPASPPRPQQVTRTEESALREKAEKRVKQRTRVLEHIATYVLVNGFLVVVWALTGAGYPWFLWVMAGWGLGLALNVASYFTGSKGDSARERMIQEEIKRMREGQE